MTSRSGPATLADVPPADPFYTRLGEQIRGRRRAKQLTQEGVAAHMGLTRTSIVNIEKGRQHLAVHQLVRISDLLGCAPGDLIPAAQEEVILSARIRDQLSDQTALSFISEISAEAQGLDR
ncbi:MAG TPA: helix-turn-helix transcriptional regulator [Streptosporangiaceae bacterium]|nr:helix-turn-helix transcriptional regulator [Streptosporangiaceae bacterium]